MLQSGPALISTRRNERNDDFFILVKENKIDAKEEANEAGRRKENVVKATERMNNSMS